MTVECRSHCSLLRPTAPLAPAPLPVLIGCTFSHSQNAKNGGGLLQRHDDAGAKAGWRPCSTSWPGREALDLNANLLSSKGALYLTGLWGSGMTCAWTTVAPLASVTRLPP